MRRHKKKRNQGDVELNLAAMLDMAFQLLTFFILTFKVNPIEGQISLKLPPPEAIQPMEKAQAAGQDNTNTNPIEGANTLLISVISSPAGGINSMAIYDNQVANLGQLSTELRNLFLDEGNPFDQVVIQVGSSLKYEHLMSVIDVCTKQTLPDGQKLSKLSFVEMTTP